MPWCPKCKNEYRNGMTTCADCKIALVDSLDDVPDDYDLCELTIVKQKAAALRLVKYLRYSGIGFVDIKAIPETRGYQILVDNTEKKEAVKHYKAFLVVETELSLQTENSVLPTEEHTQEPTSDEITENSSEAASPEYDVYVRNEDNGSIQESVQPESEDSERLASDSTNEDSIEEEFRDLIDFDEIAEETSDDSEELENELSSDDAPTSNSAYVKKEDAYQDNKSTGTMFLGFSILGFIFIGLNVTGVISFITGTFQLIVITALFVAFFILGIYSLKRAKEVAGGIDAEKEMTSNINSYLESLGDIRAYDDSDWADLNDELLYFKRTTRLKQMVTEKFGEMNESYLDCIIEEYYNSHF